MNRSVAGVRVGEDSRELNSSHMDSDTRSSAKTPGNRTQGHVANVLFKKLSDWLNNQAPSSSSQKKCMDKEFGIATKD